MKNLTILFFTFSLICLSSCDDDDNLVVEPAEPEPVGEEWIAPEFAALLQERGIIDDADAVTPSMVKDVTELSVQSCGLTSLRGIERFSSLEKLNCQSNSLEMLDVSGLDKLTRLECAYNRKMTQLKVDGCASLDYLDFANSSVEAIDVSDCVLLTELGCGNNELWTLDLTGLSMLKNLYCYGNYLEEIDISHCPDLEQLISFDNFLEGLDITNNRKLTLLYTTINPGKDGKFVILAWFGDDEVPDDFTSGSWEYDDMVTVEYVKAV